MTKENTVRALSADEIDAVGGGNVIVDGARMISLVTAAIGIAANTLVKGIGLGLRPPCE